MSPRGADLIRRTSNTDNYSTPVEAVYPILEEMNGVIVSSRTIYEPCAGEGNIVKAIKQFGHGAATIYSSDIRHGTLQNDDPERNHWDGLDFLHDRSPFEDEGIDTIITNPPFSIAEEIAQRALAMTEKGKGVVALLLRLQFLEGRKRSAWLEATPLRTVYVFRDRVSMYPEGYTGKRQTGTQAFAWFVWDWLYTKVPMLSWIETKRLEERS